MKKINKYLILFLSLATFIACDEDNNGLGEENPEYGWLQFDGTDPSVTIINDDLINDDTSEILIPFRFTAPINPSDIVLEYTISDVEGNSSEILTAGTNSATIAANSLDGTISVGVDLASLIFNLETTYTFDVVMQSNNMGHEMGINPDFSSSYRVTIKRCTPAELAGMYSVTTTYGFHDFLPDNNPITKEVEITALGDGNFSVDDFSGGLWPDVYSLVYSMGDGYFPLIFSELCNDVIWSGQTEIYGDVLMDDNGPNEYDPATGVLTISWTCTGYGEYGTSIYTPL